MASILSDIKNLFTLIIIESSDFATSLKVSINASVMFVIVELPILLSSPFM